jgi:hypothetical protein
VQRAVPAAAFTEAFAWSFAVITAGNVISGVVIQSANTAAAFVSAGGLSLAGAVFGAWRLAVRQQQQPAQRSQQLGRP